MKPDHDGAASERQEEQCKRQNPQRKPTRFCSRRGPLAVCRRSGHAWRRSNPNLEAEYPRTDARNTVLPSRMWIVTCLGRLSRFCETRYILTSASQ